MVATLRPLAKREHRTLSATIEVALELLFVQMLDPRGKSATRAQARRVQGAQQ